MEKSSKTRVDYQESPEMVTWILKNITDAVKSPSAKYTATPGVQYFKLIEGKIMDHSFKIEHIPPVKRSDTETLYASYDNFEFSCKLESNIFPYFYAIAKYIEKKFIYDMNSDSYVLRPIDKTPVNTILQWWRSRKR